MGGRGRAVSMALLLGLAAVAVFPAEAGHGTGPHLTGITTADLRSDGDPTPNGKIDTLILTFDKAIDETTLRVSDFRVDGRQITGYEMASPSVVHLWIKEGVFDTGATPSVTFDAGHLRGTTGQPAASTATATLDGAAPVLVSARVIPGSVAATLRFSEPVTAASTITKADLDYQDQSGDGASAIADGTVVHSSDVITFDLDVAAAGSDVDTDLVGPASTIQDAAGNTAHPGTMAVARLAATEVRANIGSPDVRVVFNVPVESASGGSVSAITTFDIVYDAPPDDPIEGVDSVTHQAGDYEVVVRLTDKVSADDVRSLEPARLQILAERIAEASTGDLVPFASLPLVDKQAPRALAAVTLDRNQNGFLDGIGLFWSEPVTPVCADDSSFQIGDPDGRLYELDLDGGQLPIVLPNGTATIIPIQEQNTKAPDTGHLPAFRMAACNDGLAPFTDLADPPNEALHVGIGALDEVDFAQPSIVTGETLDRDANGLLDAYALRFSELMDRGGFDAADWSVEGHNVTGGTWDGDDKLILTFDENPASGGDTGDLPGVTYTGTALTDKASQKLLPFEGGGFVKVDRAAPRITSALGDEGSRLIRLQFSEGVEAVTDPENDPTGPGRGLQERDFAYQNGGGGNTGIIDVRHSKGDRIAFLDLARPLESVDFGSGGDQVLPLPGHVRESNTKPAGERLTVAGQLIGFEEKDVDPPGAPEAPSLTVGVHNATLSFTAPADDADPQWDIAAADTGNVTAYKVNLTDGALGAGFDAAAFKAATPWPDVTPDPAILAAPGQEQRLEIGGLCPATGYEIAFGALDEDGNHGFDDGVMSFTTLEDTTAPTGTLAFLSTIFKTNETGAPIGTHIAKGPVAWNGADDLESCDLRYYWRLADDPGVPVTAQDNRTDQAGIDLTIPDTVARPAKLFLLVASANDQDVLAPAQAFPLQIIQPAECVPDNIAADSEVVHQGGFTLVTWDPLELDLPEDVRLEGYQVWRQKSTGKAWELRADLALPLDELKFIDDGKVDSTFRYLVTGYMTGGACKFAVDEDNEVVLIETADGEVSPLGDFEGQKVRIVQDPPAVPAWVWVTLTAISLLVFGAVALFYGARRTKLDESFLAEEDEEEPDHDNPFGSDPIDDLAAGEHAVEDDPFADPASGGDSAAASGGGPTLDISCPACTHNFQVQGHRPLQITCPNCSASGVLE